ncbi:MAG: 50S ribosomal protein L25/general stress protein Ctc [Gammaproteobacteria bacterium]|jgi:large subunit ribosomal protein L25|nr:50S ribosomal protein L25/general stress protein Ctc [Gammaproteobacteria bacterium]MDP6616166.1 50S ribosomal protein L25/general stress protein Ctc [Gammaproteobacteria bacterium]MDP6695626.1 50S ribosomal protein L25/general stress protein Ctc [Gammaproteobacteria bacterium]MDP7041034.1 50S ribosomal protein L25/general stress protein Ctc [Gammaproteobacteria bacterium]
MAEALDLVAEFREDTGKGSSRRLRHAGRVPAIIYGAGREPRTLTFDHNALLRATENESFFSSVLNVQVGPNVRKAILKDIQVHPSKRQILHLDLQRIVEDEKIKMTVPIHYINEETAAGVKEGGGSVSKMRTEVEVSCFPANLPEYLEVDVESLELDEMLHLSDIKLPEGVELTDLIADPPRDEAIVSVHVLRVAEEPEEVEEEEEAIEGEEGAVEGEEGAEEAGGEDAAGGESKDSKESDE